MELSCKKPSENNTAEVEEEPDMLSHQPTLLRDLLPRAFQVQS